jgi:predicted transposase
MKNTLQIKLLVSPEQALKLLDLQKTFAMACDVAALFVSRSRSWHRVTLHHLAYKSMREKFPSLGSQMVCNAIHTVSKACKEIFQDPNSRWTAVAKSGQPLPILKFSDTTPVFFDKHTLTLKKNALSIFTLDGRMHIQINLSEAIETKLRTEKLKELSLLRQKNLFYLRFVFSEDAESSMPIKPSVKVIPDSYPEPLAA